VLLIPAAAAAFAWQFLPGSGLDRAAITTVAGSFANPPLFVTGKGTHAAPWQVHSMTAVPRPDTRQAPVIISLGDDLENFFQASPPAPIDLAVVFSNIHRLGAKKAATAALLAWEAPDPIGLAALDKALGKFDSLVTAAPLSRGAVPAAMPPAFRRASLPVDAIQGDVSLLPRVNRVPLPGVIHGGENAAAGFSVLESEPAAAHPPLMARWEDRVVFAFPLLTVLQRNNIPLESLVIRLGESIRLGPAGPMVPLDRYGRLAMPLKPLAPFKEIPAELLIDGGDDLFPKTAPDPVILRDDQSAAEPATRAFSATLAATVAAIASEEGFFRPKTYRRLSLGGEFLVLACVVLAIALSCRAGTFKRHIALAGIAAIGISAQWIGAGMAGVWLPGLPVLAALGAAAIVGRVRPAPPAGPRPAPIQRVPPQPPSTAVPAQPAKPARQPAKSPGKKSRPSGKKSRK
jgi:hypothetical protein